MSTAKPVKKFSAFVHQPDELVAQIADHLEVQDRLRLSSTCWRMRLIIGAEFFRVTKFTNSERDAMMIGGLAKSKGNVNVKHLHFEGKAPTDRSRDYRKISHIMPGNVHAVLSDVHQFPNLEKVIIEFNFSLQRDEWDVVLCDLFIKLDLEATLAGETDYAWKALMARTFEALLANRTKGIKNICFENLPPLLVSTYWNPRWREFLAKVEDCRLSIWGADCGHSNNVLATGTYRQFFDYIDWAFSSRLTNVTSLDFDASAAGMVSGQSMNSTQWPHTSFPLDGSHMRKLKNVKFHNIILTTELIDFLLSHVATLEKVAFIDCYGFEERRQSSHDSASVRWHEVFNALADARAPRLRSFTLTTPSLPQTHLQTEPDENGNMPDQKDIDVSRELCKLASASPGAHVFPYGHISSINGIDHGWDVTLRHFKSGKDQDAYNGLLGFVSANEILVPTRLQQLAAKYKSSMAFISARAPNVKPAAPERAI